MNDLDLLFEAWLTRDLEETEAQRLLALLTDPAARHRWRCLTDLEGGLAEHFAAQRAEPAEASPNTTRRLRPVRRSRRQARRSTSAAFALVAAALFLLLGGLWLMRADQPADTSAPVVHTRATSTPSQLPLLNGQRLPAGTEVHGPAELRWDDGSLISVMDAAHGLIARDAPGLDLEHGDFTVATASSAAAAGFRLRSAQTDIHVLGTRFSVQVDAASTSVAVSSGAVELHPVAGNVRRIGPGESHVVGRTQPPEQGLVAWWPLDDGEGLIARDASGEGHHGTVVGATWRHVDGRPALHLPGGDARVDITPLGRLATLHEDDYSIVAHYRAAQVPPDQSDRRDRRSIIVGRSGWTLGLSLEPNGTFQMQHFLDGVPLPQEQSAKASTPAVAGRWHQLIGVVNRGRGITQLWIDGTLAAERRWPTAGMPPYPYAPTDLWRFGISKPGASIRWAAHGELREVRLYRRALNAHDVMRLAPALP